MIPSLTKRRRIYIEFGQLPIKSRSSVFKARKEKCKQWTNRYNPQSTPRNPSPTSSSSPSPPSPQIRARPPRHRRRAGRRCRRVCRGGGGRLGRGRGGGVSRPVLRTCQSHRPRRAEGDRPSHVGSMSFVCSVGLRSDGLTPGWSVWVVPFGLGM